MNVLIRMQIHSGFSSISSLDKFVVRHITLPFAPFEGLSLVCGEDEIILEDLGYGALSYDVDQEMFNIHLENKYLYNCGLKQIIPAQTIDEICQEYLDKGWVMFGDR